MRRYSSLVLFLAIAFYVSTAWVPATWGQVALWTGAGDGVRYSDPANWSTSDVPINGGGNGYNVIVPDGLNILFDVSGTITGMSFGSGGKIDLIDGVEFFVEGVAAIDSEIEANGVDTRFEATGQGVSIGVNVPISVTSGAVVEVGPTEYNSSTTIEAIISSGPGSRVAMPQTQTLNNSGGLAIFRASNQGLIDWPDLTNSDGGAGENRFVIDSQGEINLDSLASLDGGNRFQILSTDLSLNNLSAISGGSKFEIANGLQLSLPSLLSASGGRNEFNLGDDSVVLAAALTRLDDTTLSLGANVTFSAGGITSFENSIVEFGSLSQGVDLGPLNMIDNSQLSVVDGATLAVDATSFARSFSGSSVALRADQPDSFLDVSEIVTFENISPIPPNLGNPPYITTVIAENGGVIDMSSAVLIDGGARGSFGRTSLNHFIIRTNGVIKLDSLETIDQLNTFDVDVPQLDLNSLQQAGGVTFNLGVATVLNTPILLTVQGGGGSSATMPVFSTWNLPQLQTFQDAQLYMEVGAFFNAPTLTSFVNSYVELFPGVNFTTGQLTQIDNSQFFVTGGFEQILDAESYSRTLGGSSNVFHVDGTGSRIDASGIEVIDNRSPIPPNVGNAAYVTSFIVENNGTLDLSAVETIDGGSRGSFGRTSLNRFTINSGGQLQLGNVEFSGINQITVGAEGTLVTEGARFDNQSSIFATDLGILRVEGHLSHSHTSESSFNLDGGRVEFAGIPLAGLEVCGENLGTSADGLSNFGFQQLSVGDSVMGTQLVLADRIDNGNRTVGPESQYLLEVGGTGLGLSNGSELVLNGLDLYFSDLGSGDLQSIRSQFSVGQRRIVFDDGFVSLTGEVGQIINDDFEASRLIAFNVAGEGTADAVASPVAQNTGSVLRLSTSSTIEVRQNVSTFNQPFAIEFDAFTPSTNGMITLLLGGQVVATWDQSVINHVEFEKLSIVLDDVSFQDLIDVELSLRWEGSGELFVDNWNMANVETVQVMVVSGEFVQGTPSDVLASDNVDYVARRANSDIQSRVFLDIANVCEVENPTSLTFTFEAAVFARSTVNQTLMLFDYQAGEFVQVDSRVASRFADQTIQVEFTTDVARFVEPGSRQIKARVKFESSSSRQNFTASVDQAVWFFE